MSVEAFLAAAGWAAAVRAPLAGDASARRYTRLTRGAARAILMQDPTGGAARFVRMARHLGDVGLSAPAILAEDCARGLVLLEDFGDGLMARLATDPASERAHYASAVDALIALHRHPAPTDLPQATPAALAEATDLAFTHYSGRPDAAQPVAAVFEPILSRHARPADVCVLRDFHAENVLILPQRAGAARAGLIDFQDALVGHCAYDLASLLRDARRDLFPGTFEACIARYLSATARDPDAFAASFAVLGVQRNLRILGVFARLAQDGKPGYLGHAPRVWRHLQTDLRHPALAPLVPLLADLPAPTTGHLRRLEAQCPTP